MLGDRLEIVGVFCFAQILINFLQVTSIAIYMNADWSDEAIKALGFAGKTIGPNGALE